MSMPSKEFFEAQEAFQEMLKRDGHSIDVLEEKAKNGEPTPNWVSQEIAHAFITGYMLGKGYIK